MKHRALSNLFSFLQLPKDSREKNYEKNLQMSLLYVIQTVLGTWGLGLL